LASRVEAPETKTGKPREYSRKWECMNCYWRDSVWRIKKQIPAFVIQDLELKFE
jgi:hypothetical protein